jgi:hypothetical protein
VNGRKYTEPSSELAHDVVASLDQLWRLEVALVKQEAREMAIRNGVAFGLLAAGGLLLLLALLVALPVLIVLLIPAHVIAAAVWLALYLVVGAALVLIGRARLQLQVPPRTIQSLKETKAWALRQISLNIR